jgi:hypothetical protein
MCCWCAVGVLFIYRWCAAGVLLMQRWCAVGVLLVRCWCAVGAVVCCWCALTSHPEEKTTRENESGNARPKRKVIFQVQEDRGGNARVDAAV